MIPIVGEFGRPKNFCMPQVICLLIKERIYGRCRFGKKGK
jgi:hypothetical protein